MDYNSLHIRDAADLLGGVDDIPPVVDPGVLVVHRGAEPLPLQEDGQVELAITAPVGPAPRRDDLDVVHKDILSQRKSVHEIYHLM